MCQLHSGQCIWNSICFPFVSRKHVEKLVILSQPRGNIYVTSPPCWPPYGCCSTLPVPMTALLPNYSYIFFDKKYAFSAFWKLVLTENWVLAVIQFSFMGFDGSFRYQRAYVALQHLSYGITFSLSASFGCLRYSYDFYHIFWGIWDRLYLF